MSEKRKEKALEYHAKGFNCAQAVACTFCDELGADKTEIFRAAEAFGFGMGTMGTCGALSGAAICAGLKNSDGNTDAPSTKKTTYKIIKEMTKAFEDAAGSKICREIKGVDSDRPLISCNDCIALAVGIVEDKLL